MSEQGSPFEGDTLSFHISRIPQLMLGENILLRLPGILKERGYAKTALITGGSSYTASSYRLKFERELQNAGIAARRFSVSGEPSPEIVDGIRDTCADTGIFSVISIGGGSVIDTGKAVAAMLKHPGSVKDYLEGVGRKKPSGSRVPFTAVPATSGTGSEATRNAVMSETGTEGYKKSLRHEGFVPDIAVLDPVVSSSCPPDISAAAGMDAITQLLEAYVSTGASPFTDALAIDGLRRAAWALPRVVLDGSNLKARIQMAYAAYLSGIVLANAGLGIVHGAASPAGALRVIPHGVVCGTLLPSATEEIVGLLRAGGAETEKILKKYSAAAAAVTGTDAGGHTANCERLVEQLYEWVEKFNIPRLSDYGFSGEDLRNISMKSSLKGTPVKLSREQIYQIMLRRL